MPYALKNVLEKNGNKKKTRNDWIMLHHKLLIPLMISPLLQKTGNRLQKSADCILPRTGRGWEKTAENRGEWSDVRRPETTELQRERRRWKGVNDSKTRLTISCQEEKPISCTEDEHSCSSSGWRVHRCVVRSLKTWLRNVPTSR